MTKRVRSFHLSIALTALITAHAHAESPQDSSSYWPSALGVERTSAGALTVDDEIVVNSTYVESAGATVPCGESRCTHFVRALEFRSPAGETQEHQIEFVQKTSVTESCTAESSVLPENSGSVQCDYIDLRAPVIPGNMWVFHYTSRPLERQIEAPVEMVMHNEIVNTDLTLHLGSQQLGGCIRIRRNSAFSPPEPIQCQDGSSSLVFSTISVFKYYCPGVGAYQENAIETHVKRDDPDAICTQILARQQTTGVSHPNPANEN